MGKTKGLYCSPFPKTSNTFWKALYDENGVYAELQL